MHGAYLWVATIAGAVGLAALTIWFLRWFFRKPRRVDMPSELIEAISEFAEQFQKAADSMAAVSHHLALEARMTWQRKNSQILRNLRQVNRLLQRLNTYFDEERRRLECQNKGDDAGEPLGDFLNASEAERFKRMKEIQPEDRKGLDWDEIIPY